MEYDWFWVILAVGVFAAVAIVPLELALDTYWRWRNPAGCSMNVRSRGADYERQISSAPRRTQ